MPTSLARFTDSPHWDALRRCWIELKSIEVDPFGKASEVSDLKQRHTEVVGALVASGELEGVIADEVRVAFDQAVAHAEGKMALCYIAFPIEYGPRQDLMEQIAVLQEVASQSDIDPATIAQVRAAMGRDIAWLEQFQAGKSPGELGVTEANWASLEAARIIVELMLGDWE